MPKLLSVTPLRLALSAAFLLLLGLAQAHAAPPRDDAGRLVATPPFAAESEDPLGLGGETVKVNAFANRTQVIPGSRVIIAVVFDHAPGWHIHTNDPQVPPSWDFSPIATQVTVAPVPGFALARIQWPTPTEVLADLNATGPLPYGVFGDRAVVYVPFNIDPAATAGERVIELKVGYQACDDKVCQNPVTDTFKVKVLVGTAIVEGSNQSDFANFDISGFESTTEKLVIVNLFGTDLKFNPAGAAGFALLLGAAILGGLLLNFTPCVLPVIPIKMMGLSHAAGSRGKTLFLGVMMALGVIAFWVAIGAAIALIKGFTAVNQLFQSPWFSIGVGVFIAVMAIGMFGAFTFNLPQWVYAVDPKRNTVGGSLVFGVMTAVLSTPCTAPFGGAAMAWAATQSLLVTLTTFAAIGFGMAIPYLVLAAFPQLVKGVPRSGPASELLKQVLGMLMLAVAIFFIGVGLDPQLRSPVDPPIRIHWYLMAAVVTGAFGWMIYRLFKLKVRPIPRGVFTALGLLAIAGTLLVTRSFTDRGPINWVGFTNERYAQALKDKKIIVTDFTAEWCLNCKTLEATVLHQPSIVAALNDPRVIAFRVDLTGDNPEGQARLQELKWVGIPLLAIQGPTMSQPAKFDTYTPQVVLDSMAKAGWQAPR